MSAYDMMEDHILLTASRVRGILREHGITDMEEFLRDNGNFACYDAFDVFSWLGY